MMLLRTKRAASPAVAIETALIFMLALVACQSGEEPPKGSDRAERSLEKLRSVPYTNVSDQPVDAATSGVRLYERERTSDGYNLYCSRIRPEVRLMDMSGEIVHIWTYPPDSAATWDHAIMLPDGDVVVIEKFKYLLRLNWDSGRIWRKPMELHHDIIPLSDGTFYAIAREVREHRGLQVRFSAIVHLSSDGLELGRWSTYDHLEDMGAALDRRSFLDTVLDTLIAYHPSALSDQKLHRRQTLRKYARGNRVFDYFHLNTITIVPDTPLADDPRFTPGNLLVCFRNVNQIAILERESKEILWAWGEGELQWPHHPTMLADGNILIFDNGVERKSSRVLELDPVAGRIGWQYAGRPPRSFYTYEKGSAQRLPNGNTLISEGNEGRVFEVTTNGEIVWEWLNPETEEGHRAQIYRMERLEPDMVSHLLGRWAR